MKNAHYFEDAASLIPGTLVICSDNADQLKELILVILTQEISNLVRLYFTVIHLCDFFAYPNYIQQSELVEFFNATFAGISDNTKIYQRERTLSKSISYIKSRHPTRSCHSREGGNPW